MLVKLSSKLVLHKETVRSLRIQSRLRTGQGDRVRSPPAACFSDSGCADACVSDACSEPSDACKSNACHQYSDSHCGGATKCF